MDLPGLFIHFQKSGDKVFTEPTHNYHIDWNVVCDMAGMIGVDTIHSGMWGGYKSDNEDDLRANMKILTDRNVVPALSCGMKAELINPIETRFGSDWMANVGGAIHGDPDGTSAGASKIREAIEQDRK